MTRTELASPTPRCAFCNETGSLQRCGRCKVVHYCSREHQVAHRSSHGPPCNTIAKKRKTADFEELRLRTYPGDEYLPPNVFTVAVGHFWRIHETRDYMRARFALTEALQQVKTHDAVQAQLDHLLDMLQLCRPDNMGVRNLVPALMLRLNKDQECYDFVKWWNTTAENSQYAWGDMELPFLDIRDADVFEPVDYLCSEFKDLSKTAAITLLKIKLLLDLTALRDATITEGVAGEALKCSETFTPRSPIIAMRMHSMSHGDVAAAIEKLTAQVDKLYATVQKLNKRFWPTLLDPGKHLNVPPQPYTFGSVQEMQLALRYSYNSWIETPGAIDLIRTKVSSAVPNAGP